MKKFLVHVFQFMDSRGGTVISLSATKMEAFRSVFKGFDCFRPSKGDVSAAYVGQCTLYAKSGLDVETEIGNDLGQKAEFYASAIDHAKMSGEQGASPLYFVEGLDLYAYPVGTKPLDPDLVPIRLDDDAFTCCVVG
jgi:hypothetical protein